MTMPATIIPLRILKAASFALQFFILWGFAYFMKATIELSGKEYKADGPDWRTWSTVLAAFILTLLLYWAVGLFRTYINNRLSSPLRASKLKPPQTSLH